ncbi:MAG: sugar ABC transporter permease, partial [Planctomycetota bacterium]
TRRVAKGLAYIAPNIIGFLCFTFLPLIFAMILAFTNWDLRLHNPQRTAMFGSAPLEFVGFDNFRDLLFEPTFDGEAGLLFGTVDGWTWNRDFWKFLGNTLFFMMAIPFGIGLSLLAAILLSKDLGGGSRKGQGILLTGAGVIAGILLLVGGVATMMNAGAEMNGMVLLFCGLGGAILLGGVVGGQSVYRTLFYMPHFVAGVATFILWKKLYNTETGPFSTALRPVLGGLTEAVRFSPTLTLALAAVPLVGAAVLSFVSFRKLRRDYTDGDLGWRAAMLPMALLCVPAVLALVWYAPLAAETGLLFRLAALVFVAGVLAALCHGVFFMAGGQSIPCKPTDGGGTALMFAAASLIVQLVLLGFTAVLINLPSETWAGAPDGLEPPTWIASVAWAKPSIMFMGLWAAIGGNNMLLYIAALTNVPQELYEASEIDGAGRFSKFWNVTWPQLAPTTFFIVVMSVIGGLQGGFEMAKTMTNGGPAGQTTTVSFYIFQQGFETGRLAFSSAIAWVLFFLVFAMTLINWRFGNQYVNE